MTGIKLKRVSFNGVPEDKEVVMGSKCLKVMVKNLTDDEIYVGIGTLGTVTMENAVLIKPNCYQVVFINENVTCCCMFDTIVVGGAGVGTVECIQVLF